MKSSPLSVLSLKQLTLKLVMLTALVTGQRCQSIYLMDLSSMKKNENNNYSFPIIEKIKTSKPGKPQPLLILPKFTTNPDICLYTTLERYLELTEHLRDNHTKLFIKARSHRPNGAGALPER